MKTDEKGRPLTYWGGLDKSKKQTAVGWFAGEIKGGKLITNQKFEELLQQAKEMERQQIIDAVDCGLSSVKKSKYKTLFISKTPEECYNETFNK